MRRLVLPRGRDLRQCLGVPTDFVIDGDVEQQSYRFEHDDAPEAVHGPGGIGGVVTGVSAQGRTREGLNSDATCLPRAQPCLPYADEEEVEATE